MFLNKIKIIVNKFFFLFNRFIKFIFKRDSNNSINIARKSTFSLDIKKDFKEYNYKKLFSIFKYLVKNGTEFAAVSEIDKYLKNGQSLWFIKHDIHGMNLDTLINMAKAEKAIGLRGSYFFMAPNHPLTISHYSFEEQIYAMRTIKDIGHEIGLHVDPYFLIHWLDLNLAGVFDHILSEFDAHNITFNVGNIHGNSRFKNPDLNNFGTSFDLFQEIGRQQDFPILNNVPEKTADIIRENRISLSSYGFKYWADMPLWSKKNGFVTTNFITDNQLRKTNTLEVLIQKDYSNAFKISNRQLPGSRTPSPVKNIIYTSKKNIKTPSSGKFTFKSLCMKNSIKYLKSKPTLFLVHPEFYC